VRVRRRAQLRGNIATQYSVSFFSVFLLLEGCKFELLAILHPPEIVLYPPNFKFLEMTLQHVYTRKQQYITPHSFVNGRRVTVARDHATIA